MRSTKNIFLLRFINTIIFTILIFIQYNGVFSLKIGNANPMLPLALLVVISMFCSELSSCINGLIVGFFIDCVASTPDGFNAIILFLLGLGVSITVRHLFNNNIWSALALCGIAGIIYFIIRWVFSIAFSLSFTENLTYLIRYALPSVFYTAVFVAPFYFLEKKLYKKLYH